jgi:hypothetical protein
MEMSWFRLLLRRSFWCALLLAAGTVVGAQALLQPRAASAQSDPAVVGQWSAAFNFQIVAVHTVLLPNGKIWYYPYGDNPRIWDPVTSTFSNPALAGFNIFCTGHSALPDGRHLITGGHRQNGWGLPNAAIYDPANNTWTHLPDMNNGRWYPTNTTLSNGEVLVISGSYNPQYHINTLPQVWTGSGWRNLTGAEMSIDLYPAMFLAPNGRVFMAGPGQTTRYIDTAGTGSWSTVANRQFPYRGYGSAAMYDNGKVFYAGGGDPPTNTAEVIDLGAPNPSWRYVGSMQTARRQINTTILADGQLLVTGGSSGNGFNNKNTPVYTAELWNPQTEQFTTMASMQHPRWYHSTALLLPDGRVLSAGGDDYPTAEIFSPPYLFKGARPTITTAPSSADHGQTVSVGTPDAASITAVNLIRLSSVTHATNMDQRINRLSFTQSSGALNVTIPSDPKLCPPGPYMLFIVNNQGVPSVAAMMSIGGSGGGTPPGDPPGLEPPAAPSNLTATRLNNTRIRINWQDNSNNEDGFKIERSTDGVNFTQIATVGANTTSFTNSGLSRNTTYYYRVRAFNQAGDSAYSNVASATT